MKKVILIIITCLLILGCDKVKTFYLDDEYYENDSLTEIDNDKLKDLEKNESSFIIFIYQPLCTTSYDFNEVLTDYVNTNEIGLYKITFGNIDDTNLAKHIKYFPTVAIYQKGKIITHLDPNKNEDIPYYESVEGFDDWLTQYVLLK
ncbi:MAG: hypothetical protein PHG03_00500 [Bacilli bacterium]|nr:hypothetical protein [Bacilli bacterium]MDD4795025.1 hypothetical protein [Bacilli bacterium]